MKKKLYIIGAGPGSEEFLTQRAIHVLRSCDRVYSTAHRYTKPFSDINANILECQLSEIPAVVEASDGTHIVLLVSGDTGFFSIAATVLKRLQGIVEIEVVCGISSLQYLCSQTGISHENIKVVSLHGRENSIVGAVSYNHRVFVLTGGANKAHRICKSLVDAGLSHIRATIGENLSLKNERIVTGTVKELARCTFGELSVLLLENPEYVNCHIPLKDGDFVRGEVPMTKEEIRAVTLSKLAIEPGDIVYDIGAGTGSVAVEMARKACDGLVYAIEKNPAAVELICKNREKLGAFNIAVVPGTAPEIFAQLPVPDKAFIGGSSGNTGQLVRALLNKNRGVSIVANAITLESVNAAVSSFESNGLSSEIVCINSAVSIKAGGYHMMKANNPVYIVSGKLAKNDSLNNSI